MKRSGFWVFGGAVLLALAVYMLTRPEGLPWNPSTHLAEAYLGASVRFPRMPQVLWGWFVQLFGSATNLSIALAALTAGLLGVIVNGWMGWRVAASAVLLWIFLPSVWYRAVTGAWRVSLAAVGLAVLWALVAVVKSFVRHLKIKKYKYVSVGKKRTAREKRARLAAWSVLAVSGLVALVLVVGHDYRYGEAASAFARGIVEAADGRIVVLNGVCDDQIVRELSARGEDGTARWVSLRKDDCARSNLVDWVKATFPGETNFLVAARVDAAVFAEIAVRKYPERFYVMNGGVTTREQWEKRWQDFQPYLKSYDPFVPFARRMFGYEGNVLANAAWSQAKDEAAQKAAFALYRRIYVEIDPGNLSALLNMYEMDYCGCPVSRDDKALVRERLERFLKVPHHRTHFREIARLAGPVRIDRAIREKMAEFLKKRAEEKRSAEKPAQVNPELRMLVEWNQEMLELMDKGDKANAGRIARKILARPRWRGFMPAHAVLGVIAADDGDDVSSERFFQMATYTTNEVAAVVLVNYAGTLTRLGKLAEAEKVARRALAASGEKSWQTHLTLAEVLEKRLEESPSDEKDHRREIKDLLKEVLTCAPVDVSKKIRLEHRKYLK